MHVPVCCDYQRLGSKYFGLLCFLRMFEAVSTDHWDQRVIYRAGLLPRLFGSCDCVDSNIRLNYILSSIPELLLALTVDASDFGSVYRYQCISILLPVADSDSPFFSDDARQLYLSRLHCLDVSRDRGKCCSEQQHVSGMYQITICPN